MRVEYKNVSDCHLCETACSEFFYSPFYSCEKVRTLIGVPQPSSVCPVGDFDLAVLCKREIRIIDLNQGKFKVNFNQYALKDSISFKLSS